MRAMLAIMWSCLAVAGAEENAKPVLPPPETVTVVQLDVGFPIRRHELAVVRPALQGPVLALLRRLVDRPRDLLVGLDPTNPRIPAGQDWRARFSAKLTTKDGEQELVAWFKLELDPNGDPTSSDEGVLIVGRGEHVTVITQADLTAFTRAYDETVAKLDR